MSLDRLLEIWRETRHPRVAHLVRALSAGAPMPDLHATKAWNDAVGQNDPRLMPALLASVTSGYSTVARMRLNQLGQRSDPRLVDAIVGWTQGLPYRTPPRADEWWAEVRAVLARQAPPDFDVDAVADGLLLRHSTNYAVKISNSFRRVRLAPFEPRAFTDEESALLAALEEMYPPDAEVPSGHASIPELLDAVAENPDDDAPRLVLADVLQQQGDPRGEFIALQFARLDGAGDPDREAALLQTHLGEWAGPWPPALGTTTFEKGFLHGLTLERKLAKLGKLKADPFTRTLARLSLEPVRLNAAAERALPKVLATLPHLSDLGVVRIAHVEGVEPLKSRLKRVAIEVHEPDVDRICAWVGTLERLEHLDLVPGFRVEGPTLASIATAVNVPSIRVRQHWDGGLAGLLSGLKPGVRTLEYGGHYHSRLQLQRNPDGAITGVHVALRHTELQLDVLAELPTERLAGVPFTLDPYQEVIVGDWAVLPRLADVGEHFPMVEYWGREGAAEPEAAHFVGLPSIDLLHVSLLSEQRDHGPVVQLVQAVPQIAVLEITHSLRLTRDASCSMREGELRSRWWEADDRMHSALPHLEGLRRVQPEGWMQSPEDADDRYAALCARFGLTPR